MFTDKQLEQLQKLFQINNKTLLKAINKDNKKEIQTASKELKRELMKAINDSQQDTIDVLLAAIHTGYNLHEKRIKRVEDELDLPPLKQ